MDKIIHIIHISFKTPQPNVFLETNLKTRLSCVSSVASDQRSSGRLPKQECEDSALPLA